MMNSPNTQNFDFNFLSEKGEKLHIMGRIIEGRFDINTLETWLACIIEIKSIESSEIGKHKIRIAEPPYVHFDISNNQTINSFKDFAKDRAMTGNWSGESETVIHELAKSSQKGFSISNSTILYKRNKKTVELERSVVQYAILDFLNESQKPYELYEYLFEILPIPSNTLKKEINNLLDLKYIEYHQETSLYLRITAQGIDKLRRLDSDNKAIGVDMEFNSETKTDNREIKVFICHVEEDSGKVRNLYKDLINTGFISPWLDKKDLLPGQKWELEIRKSVRSSDAIIVCLSKISVYKEGYFQKEIEISLDEDGKKPEGTIYIIPLRLEECDVPPQLEHLHREDLFKYGGLKRVKSALKHRLEEIKAKKK